MNEYDNDEHLADDALDLWLSNPPQHTVTLCHRTSDALDDYGNVLGGFTVSRERSGWHLSLYSVTGCMYKATLTDRWQEKVLTRLSECSKLIAGQQAAARSSKKNFQKPLASPKDFSHTRFTPTEKRNTTMAIVTTVTAHTFANAFVEMGRMENFSHIALDALFEYYEQLSEETSENIELDVIAICCEWSELDEEQLFNEHGTAEGLEEHDGDMDEYKESIIEELENSTYVIQLDNGNVLVQAF